MSEAAKRRSECRLDARVNRRVLLVTHTGRPAARERAGYVAKRLLAAGVEVHALATESDEANLAGVSPAGTDTSAANGMELVLVLGGDGTLLRGAELARSADIPLLGVNLGHVGFLAEADPADLDETLERVLAADYVVEERMTVDVEVEHTGQIVERGWALNEAAISKTDRARMLECLLAVDGRPVSRFGCDGVVCATPTGSTAYAFSGGGPVVWPEVAALLVVPISAHALFARPLVTSPESEVVVEVLAGTSDGGALLWCDGRRVVPVAAGDLVRVRRGARPVRLARLHDRPFTDRLVAKFSLPVDGWRGAGEGAHGAPPEPPGL